MLVEGTKGLHDGVDVNGKDSNAALAHQLGLPVVLVLDARGITRGIAPLLQGTASFDTTIQIAGVILNFVAGERHEQKLRAALSRYTDIPVLGAIRHDPGMVIGERHLGLVTVSEHTYGQAQVDPTPDPTPTETLASQVESACRSIIFEDTPVTHCLAVPARHSISMALGRDGKFYRSLTDFAAATDAQTVAFAMNAGMFDDDGEPIGYFVEDSERLHPLNTADGEGNFHMNPNGVFYGTDGEWAVRATDWFLENVTERPQFGTQSGPMLVVDGKIHPEITRDGPSKFVRNAVGVDDEGRAHFVISNAPISFGKLARFYKDELHVKNALYLDGNVSQLWNPATERLDTGAPIGPIVVVRKKASE